MADQHHPPPVDAGEAAEDRRIFAIGPVAGQRHELIGDSGDIILEVRSLGMARDLRLLPRRQFRISVGEQLRRLGLELVDFGLDVDLAAVGGFLELADSRLELGDRLFEVEVGQRRVSVEERTVNENGRPADAAR